MFFSLIRKTNITVGGHEIYSGPSFNRPQTKFGTRQCFHRCLSDHGRRGEGVGALASQHASQVTLPASGGGVYLRGSASRGFCPWEVGQTPARNQKSGRYASYWNAFLFLTFVYTWGRRWGGVWFLISD